MIGSKIINVPNVAERLQFSSVLSDFVTHIVVTAHTNILIFYLFLCFCHTIRTKLENFLNLFYLQFVEFTSEFSTHQLRKRLPTNSVLYCGSMLQKRVFFFDFRKKNIILVSGAALQELMWVDHWDSLCVIVPSFPSIFVNRFGHFPITIPEQGLVEEADQQP